jgi:hypothetical protein
MAQLNNLTEQEKPCLPERNPFLAHLGSVASLPQDQVLLETALVENWVTCPRQYGRKPPHTHVPCS